MNLDTDTNLIGGVRIALGEERLPLALIRELAVRLIEVWSGFGAFLASE
jgi:hypothetical protein